MNAILNRNVLGCALAALGLCLLPPAFGATIRVTNDYPTIQAAINAASSNDTILVQAGTYGESLNITTAVNIVGSGSTNCILYQTNDPLISITSAGVVGLSGLGINGGVPAFGGGYSPSVTKGIVATNSTVVLNDVTVDNTRNYAVTVVDGSLYVTNVTLYTRNILQQWDVGFQLKGCFARFYQLTQVSGQIDHTININDTPANYSDVRIENCTIRASHLGYGECIRTYTKSSLVITDCYLYRAAGGDAVSIGNQAIGVNGYSNTVWITGNVIDNVPTGIRVFGSIQNSNTIKVEHNKIINCQSNGVLETQMSYEGIDLGGGPFDSEGQNFFYNPGARDVELSSSAGNMHAISNCWTTADPDASIFDQLDSGALGRVTSSPAFCADIALHCSLAPDIVTNVVGLADNTVVTATTNGNPAVGASVAFSVTSGPNSGQSTNVTTDSSGQAAFLYVSNGTEGADIIQAIVTVYGFSSTCTATKMWFDPAIAPTITCPSNITTNNAPGQCGRSIAFAVTTNGVPDPTVTFLIGTNAITSPYFFDVGATTVSCIATNTKGSDSCSFDVMVNDTELPSITCPADIATNIPFGQASAVVTFPPPTVSDNCALTSTNVSPLSGSAFPVGTNTVVCTAFDVSGNTNTCFFTVTVSELPPPVTNGAAIRIVFPTNGFISVDRTVNVDGWVTNDVTIDSLVVTNSRSGSYSLALNGTNWSQSGVLLMLGTNQLTAVAHDDQSNVFTDSVIVIRVNTNYADTTFRTTSATLTLGTAPNTDSLSLSGVYNDADVAFDPSIDAFEFLFGDYEDALPPNSLAKFKFKAKVSPSNTVTSVKLTTKKRTLTFAATGFNLTNGEPYMAASSLGAIDLGPDSIVFPVTSASGTFSYKYGTQLPSVDQFFLGKSSLTTNSFKLTGTLNVLAKPNVLTNVVSFGIGNYDELLPTNGWTKAAGNVYTYKRPAGELGPMEIMTLNFDLGTWNATGSGADLSFLATSPTTEFRLEVAEFAASYRAKLIPKGTKFSY